MNQAGFLKQYSQNLITTNNMSPTVITINSPESIKPHIIHKLFFLHNDKSIIYNS